MTHDDFAAAVAARASALAAGAWVFEPRGTWIEVAVAGRRHAFELHLAYRRYRGGRSAEERRVALQAAAERLVSIAADAAGLDRCLGDWEWVHPRLQVALCAAVHVPPGAAPAAAREWLPGLSIGYLVIDRQRRRVVTVTEDMRAAWGVAEAEVHAVAWERLVRSAAPLRRMSSLAEVYGFCCTEEDVFLGAAQVLLPGQMERAAEACRSDELLVGIPEPQAALVWAADGAAARWMRRVVASLHAEAPLPLSADPVLWEAGRWTRPSALQLTTASD
jgi:hypothetical protein